MSKGDNPNFILFSILNWGLGHATRSIVVIRQLQKLGYSVVVCTDGFPASFLANELDNIKIEYLPSYSVSYKWDSMTWNMILQSPKILRAIYAETRAFKKLVSIYKPVACFSDNRYGCYSKNIPSFFIGHQWNLLSPQLSKHYLASLINHFLIRKFDAFLVPDEPNIQLSHKLNNSITRIKNYYLGFLSRMGHIEKDQKLDFDALAILSGPEPARTKLENRIIEVFNQSDKVLCLVRGTNRKLDVMPHHHIVVHDIVQSEELEKLILKSKHIISRSGYSSLMDYIAIGRGSYLFIPTPGQTEQVYLAKQMQEIYQTKQIAQEEFNRTVLNNLLGESPQKEAPFLLQRRNGQESGSIQAQNSGTLLLETLTELKRDFHF